LNNFEYQLQAKVINLGLILFGITSPEPPTHFDIFEQWLSQKTYGQMDFLGKPHSIEKRKYPKLILPNCKSIIVVGLPNLNITPKSTLSGKNYGRVASFATSRDYHDVLMEKMTALRDYIHTSLDQQFQSKLCVDSNPVLEKSIAQQAGLGWIGKNSLLISPTAGSFINLGEIFLDIDLNFTSPFANNLCKDCHLCIDACPTGCINSNRTLNANKCISYLTIEHKGIIERQLRNLIENWIFGCDICQQACPFNKGFLKECENELDNMLGFINLDHEITLSESEFLIKYKESPIMRIGYNGFLRNLIIAMGNSQQSSSIPALGKILTTAGDPILRTTSAWALGKTLTQTSKNILEKALKNEVNPDVREEIIFSLAGPID